MTEPILAPIRRVLPPLGNDFISMLKDSSLVSVLGVRDITHAIDRFPLRRQEMLEQRPAGR